MQTQNTDLTNHPDVLKARDHLQKKTEALKRAQDAAREAKDRESAAEKVAAEDLSRARLAEKQAVQAAQAEQLNKLQKEYRIAVEKLSAAIAVAAKANEHVADLYAQAQMLSGGRSPLPILHWSELAKESATKSTKLSNWQRQVEAFTETQAASPRLRRRLNGKE